MKSRSDGKNVSFFWFSVYGYSTTGRLCLRDHLAIVSRDANDWILANCFYCKGCRVCSINSALYKELSRIGFWTVNKHVKWWSLVWFDDLPVLTPHKP